MQRVEIDLYRKKEGALSYLIMKRQVKRGTAEP